MKTRLLIILVIVTTIISSLLVADQYYLSLQDKELKNSDWVKNCIPVGSDKVVPAIGLLNHTHSFDLRTCSWNPTEHGTSGFLESLYISFIEPIFLDISDGLEIKYVYADCNINTDWSDAPCLDLIINGKYQQHEVDKWTDYYSYKGSIFMEEKHLELNQAIKENNLQEWVDESMTHRNVYEYYFFSGRAPNTGEYRGQFDVIKVNEDNAPQYAELFLPNITPSILYDFGLIYITILIIIVIIVSLVVGIIFVSRRKRK